MVDKNLELLKQTLQKKRLPKDIVLQVHKLGNVAIAVVYEIARTSSNELAVANAVHVLFGLTRYRPSSLEPLYVLLLELRQHASMEIRGAVATTLGRIYCMRDLACPPLPYTEFEKIEKELRLLERPLPAETEEYLRRALA